VAAAGRKGSERPAGKASRSGKSGGTGNQLRPFQVVRDPKDRTQEEGAVKQIEIARISTVAKGSRNEDRASTGVTLDEKVRVQKRGSSGSRKGQTPNV